MAFPANQIIFSILLLSAFLFSHTHARDSQLFNKFNNKPDSSPSNDQSEFLPENDNGYGLYGHDSGQLPPSDEKYLPKNYNSVAYVTEPEDSVSFNGDDGKFAVDRAHYNTGASEDSYIPRPQEDEEEPSANVAGGGSSFNTGASLYRSKRYYNGNGVGFRPQGMSDTRILENGKYFYDVGSEKYSSNHPYESLKTVRPTGYDRTTGNYVYSNGDRSGFGFHGDQYGPEWNNLP